jgi:hypothetical protein
MAGELLSSKIVINEEPPSIRNIPGIPTAVTAFVGVAERGPMNLGTFVTSQEEYQRNFGGPIAAGQLWLQVRQFFLNGGSAAWIVRTAHHTDITDAGTNTAVKATVDLDDRDGTPDPTLNIQAKDPGAYGNSLEVIIENATSGAADEFNLKVEFDGVVAEVFPNLSMTDTDPNYVEAVINDPDTGSIYIRATDLDSPNASPTDLPALTAGTPLTGGNDGLVSLDDNDFIGDAGGATGMHALDVVQEINLLLIPDRATSAVHNAMITYCEVTRQKSCFAVLDPPASLSAVDIVTYVDTTAGLLNLSEFGAIYWPRVKVLNPSTIVFGSGEQITIPPSGSIAGTYARIDASRPGGVYVQPAGVENGILFGVLGFETDEVKDEAKRDLIFPKRINPLTVYPGTPRHIDGARTLKGNGNFPSVGERRGVIFIEQSIKAGLLFAKNQNHTEALRETVRKTIFGFLLLQLRNGAFRSSNPSEAFFVDVSAALNPPTVVFANQLRARIGLATNKPAEFIILTFTQDTRALDEEIATAGGV